MEINRRQVLRTAATGTVALAAGCLGSDDDGDDGGCETRTEHLLDQYDTVSAGTTLSWRFELSGGDVLTVEAQQTGDGARPSAAAEDPDGAELFDAGPEEQLSRQLTAQQDGRYYVKFYNSATFTSGTWDMDVRWEGC